MSIAEKTTPRQIALTAAVVLVVVATAVTVVFRLGRQPEAGTAASAAAGDPTDDSLVAARDILFKAADAPGCRTAVEELNRYLNHHPDDRPVPLTKDEQEQLADWFGLDPGEQNEVASPTFTALDAHHLDTCLLLHDAAQALDVGDLPPAARAEAGFDWVMRQVRFGARAAFTAPPAFVLRRGWGNTLERALVFLTLLPQLGLDGCVVACPHERDGATEYRPLLGVLARDQVLLFDPDLGMALPGPGGKGVATLSQALADPNVLGQLTVDRKYPYGLTREDLRRARVWIPCTLSGLSARMKYLESVLSDQSPVKLAADPGELLARFKKAVGGQRIEVGFWSRTVERNAPTSTLRQFLPPAEGGANQTRLEEHATRELFALASLPQLVLVLAERETPPGPTLLRYYQEMFIRFPLPEPRTEDAGQGLAEARERERGLVNKQRTADRFLRYFQELADASADEAPRPFWLQPDSLRDDMLRGRLEQATPKLVEARDQVQQQQALLNGGGNLDEEFVAWVPRARDAQAALQVAEREYKANASAQNELTLQAARRNFQAVWQGTGDPDKGEGHAPPWLLMLFRSASEPLGAEATYLLALCRQDEAERLQRRLDVSAKPTSAADVQKARDSWESAVQWWQTYLSDFPDAPSVPMARTLKARGLAHTGQAPAAVGLLRDLSDVPGHRLTPLEKTARLYQAHRLEQRPGR